DPGIFDPPEIEPLLEAALVPPEDAGQVLPEAAAVGLAGNLDAVRGALFDRFAMSAALELLAREAPAYLQVGLPGLDVLRAAERRRGRPPEDAFAAARLTVVAGHYRLLDRFVADLRTAAGADALLVIASYPGIS